MRHLLFTALGIAILAAPVMAQSKFRSIIGDAANIEKDATALSLDMKAKSFDITKAKTDAESLGSDIAKLRKDVDEIDAGMSNLSGQQKADWELVKTKVQLLTIFHDRKSELMNGDLSKNKGLIRAHADGIAKRARLLQQTANRLDR